uniref:Uncharacterized protein n=1 Tax=Rhipicephalus zambeziensis TaxID=60191 RepID=A0A224YG61_9ACAR
MYNNNSAKSRHVHCIAYVTKPLARDPSADITDREAVHQAPHTRCSKRSSQTSKAQFVHMTGLKRRSGWARQLASQVTHAHTKDYRVTAQVANIQNRKKIKLSKERYTLELLPRTYAQYRIHWLLSTDAHDKEKKNFASWDTVIHIGLSLPLLASTG